MKSTTDLREIVVFGARGHTLLMLRGMEHFWQGRVRILALIDDIENGFMHDTLGVPVISSAERLLAYPDIPVLVTPGSTTLRAKVTAQLVAEGATLATSACPGQTHVDPSAIYDPGCFVAHNTRIGPAVHIGQGAQVLSALVAHDVVVGAYSNLNVDSSVLGHVIIGEHVNIAPNAIIGNGSAKRPLRIGSGAVIGVGAVVTHDVPENAQMIGNPAIPVDKWRKLYRWLNDPSQP
jgi:UDP-3-O-[3-hydroxymyristoyl] glucosamine N-acyltransferase